MCRFKTSILFLSMLFFAVSIKSQTDSSSLSNQVQFHFLNGYSLSYLHYLGESSALRYKVDAEINLKTGDKTGEQNNYTDYEYSSPTTQNTSFYEEENSDNENITLAVQYLRMINFNKELRLTIGAGPCISYSRSFNENIRKGNYHSVNSVDYRNMNTQKSFSFGALGSAYIEADIFNNVSLMAEYNFSIQYSWEDFNSEYQETTELSKNINENKSDGNFWNFKLSSVKLGIGFKF